MQLKCIVQFIRFKRIHYTPAQVIYITRITDDRMIQPASLNDPSTIAVSNLNITPLLLRKVLRHLQLHQQLHVGFVYDKS